MTIFDQGRDLWNNIALALSESPPASYYIALVKKDGFVGFDAADTPTSHSGWTEETRYSASARPAFVGAPSADGMVSNNAQRATFTPTANLEIKGIVLWTSSTKGGTDGTLLAGDVFTDGKPLLATAGREGSIIVKLFGEGG